MKRRTIFKNIIEVRFEPDSKILDKRGEITGSILNSQFTDWVIQENRIDFSKKGNEEFGAFFSYKNLGLYASYPNLLPFIKKNTKQFITSTWDYFKSNKIHRVGVRTVFLTETENYQKTFDSYKEKFFKVDEEMLSKFDGKLYDFGFPMNFVDGENYINVNTGPMYAKQSAQFFDKIKDIPKFGIFVDVDYYMKDCSLITKKEELIKFIEKGLDKARGYNEIITDRVVN